MKSVQLRLFAAAGQLQASSYSRPDSPLHSRRNKYATIRKVQARSWREEDAGIEGKDRGQVALDVRSHPGLSLIRLEEQLALSPFVAGILLYSDPSVILLHKSCTRAGMPTPFTCKYG